MWNYKIAIATFCASQCQDGNGNLKCYHGMKMSGHLNTLKSTLRILTGILSKYSENSELKANLNS